MSIFLYCRVNAGEKCHTQKTFEWQLANFQSCFVVLEACRLSSVLAQDKWGNVIGRARRAVARGGARRGAAGGALRFAAALCCGGVLIPGPLGPSPATGSPPRQRTEGTRATARPVPSFPFI